MVAKTLVWLATRRVLLLAWHLVCKRQIVQLIIARLLIPDASLMKKYMCLICGWIYDEETGWPEDGLKAGTLWNDVPMNWTCPECGARKDDFEMVEI